MTTTVLGRYVTKIRARLGSFWQHIATSERRAALYLLRRGFLYHREPRFVVGRVPDFLTFGRGAMWVEVKSLDQPISQERIGAAYAELKRRFNQFRSKYRLDVWISASFSQRTAKKAQQLFSREVRNGRAEGAAWYAAIPERDTGTERIELRWTHRGRSVRMVTLKSPSGVYACPPEAEPVEAMAEAEIEDDKTSARIPAYKVLSIQQVAPIMIRVEADPEGRGISSVGYANTEQDTTIDRLRRAIDDASEQLKNAQTFRKIPGVVQVFFDHLAGVGEGDILRACLGDLTIPIDMPSRVPGEAFYGANGILRPNKNTAISAVTYRPRFYQTISVINPWAASPISKEWVDGVVYVLEGNRLTRQ